MLNYYNKIDDDFAEVDDDWKEYFSVFYCEDFA
jgi:hypothetical protein